MRFSAEAIDRIIARIYDGILDPAVWDAMTLDLCMMTGAVAVHGFVLNKGDGRNLFTFMQGVDGLDVQSAVAAYEARYRWMDPIPPLMSCQRHWVTEDLIPSSQVERSEFYQDFLIPHGSGQRLATCLHESESLWGGMGFQRTRRQKRFGTPELSLMQHLGPHLKRAVLMMVSQQELIAKVNLGRASLDAMEDALIWVSPSGRIHSTNAAGETLLRRGVHVVERFGRLQVNSSHHTHESLIATIQEAAQSARACSLRLGTEAQGMLSIRIFPLPADRLMAQGEDAGLVMLSIRNDKPQAGRLATLQQTFGLSAAEGRLAVALLDDASLSEYAEVRGLAMPTVRTQIKQVFAKTGTHRQAQLVSLLTKLV